MSAQKKSWTQPHLPDGQPDFTGYWTNATYTPLERDRELGTKEFFTPAEAEAYAKKREQIENSQSKEDIHYDNVIWQGEKLREGGHAQPDVADLTTRRMAAFLI